MTSNSGWRGLPWDAASGAQPGRGRVGESVLSGSLSERNRPCLHAIGRAPPSAAGMQNGECKTGNPGWDSPCNRCEVGRRAQPARIDVRMARAMSAAIPLPAVVRLLVEAGCALDFLVRFARDLVIPDIGGRLHARDLKVRHLVIEVHGERVVVRHALRRTAMP